MDEFSLIDRYFKRTPRRTDVVCSVGDDAAVLALRTGVELVMSMDTLIEGVHFPPGTAAQDIAYKSIAVNLSDLAAMGAEPAWLTLALTLPHEDAAWLQAFADSFAATCDSCGVDLVGGDTTRGSLSISLHACGLVEQGTAMRRDTAVEGQDIWVSGSLGDAALALRLYGSEAQYDSCLQRLNRPPLRVGFGRGLREYCRCCIDVSDGLLADLGHVLAASGCGAELSVPAVPVSATLLEHYREPAAAAALALTGGDDYELCFITAADVREQVETLAQQHGLAVSRIGRTRAASGLSFSDDDGRLQRLLDSGSGGYRHFG